MTERPEEDAKEKDLTNEVQEDTNVSAQEQTEPVQDEGAESVETEEQIPEASTETTAVNETTESSEDADLDDDQDEDEDESDRMISASEDSPNVDYSSMDKEKLLQAARDANNHSPREAIRRIQEIRSYYFDILQQQKKDAFETHMHAGGDSEGFEYDDSEERKAINLIYHQAQEARKEERARIDAEKLQNLNRKRELLDKLSEITESDETEDSLKQVKEIQQEWKNIRIVPREFNQELWDRYHFFLDKFYDNHSINIELKELDRKKNLEVKIELCKKVDELKSENSLKRSFILLNKHQEEFRNTGPVPREFSQEIWDRFKLACDELYSAKKELFEAAEAERKLNLEKKELLVEKAAVVAASDYKKIKEWNKKAHELEELFAEWKNIGPVPRSQNEKIWKALRGEFNTFYKNRSNFFKELNKGRKANLIVKEDLCKRAEELINAEDMGTATKAILKLQDEWKNTGPVPDKVNNAIWKRFRTACDAFFERKRKDYEDRNKEEIENLKVKESVIAKLESLLKEDDQKKAIDQLKEIHKEWLAIGFVPRKSLKKIENAYRKATEAIYKKHKIDKLSAREGQMEDHFKNLAQLPNGDSRLKDEVHKVRKKLKFLEGEISTWENNIEFFGRSKGAQKLRDDMQGKIEKAKGQIGRLQKELKVLKKIQAEA